VTFTATPTAAGSFTVNGNVVTFSNSSNGATTYSWDFNDFTNSSASAPIHAFAGNGDYTVVLTAINGNCTDTATFNVSITVGMNEIEGLEDVKVYPNPASEMVMISFDNKNNSEVSVELLDQLGRVIETSTVVNNGLQVASFNVASIQNGLYTIRILSNGNALTRKIIVSK
jgi:PKD repeat protein